MALDGSPYKAWRMGKGGFIPSVYGVKKLQMHMRDLDYFAPGEMLPQLVVPWKGVGTGKATPVWDAKARKFLGLAGVRGGLRGGYA